MAECSQLERVHIDNGWWGQFHCKYSGRIMEYEDKYAVNVCKCDAHKDCPIYKKYQLYGY